MPASGCALDTQARIEFRGELLQHADERRVEVSAALGGTRSQPVQPLLQR